MSHKMLRPFIVKVSVLGYFPLYWFNINKLKLNVEKTKNLPFMNARILKYIYIYIGKSKIEIVGRNF